MPTRETSPIGAPCWVDLSTSDPTRARAFYGELFGWESEEPNADFGGYFNFTKGGARIAGGMTSMPEMGPANIWSVYLTTADAEKTVATAAERGGGVIAPAMEVADLGSMAVVTDPGNAVIGMWQPGLHTGFQLVAEAGAPGWFELHTRDYAAAVDFYKDVFGWTSRVASDTPEFRYTTFVDAAGDDQAGIMDASGFLPEGVPSHWSVYFGAADTRAALDKIVELGGTILQPAEDTPYGLLATAADPLGAVFKLVSPNEAMPAKSA